jgi:TPR repeat protein
MSLAAVKIAGQGLPQDVPGGMALYASSCDAGVGSACTLLATAHAEGNGVPRDDARAAALYRRGCDLADMEACMDLGVVSAEGRGVPRDEAASAELLRAACDGKERFACKLAKAEPSERATMRQKTRKQIRECNALIEVINAAVADLGKSPVASGPDPSGTGELESMADTMDRVADKAKDVRLTLPALVGFSGEYQRMAKDVARAARAMAKAADAKDLAAINAAQVDLDKAVKQEDPLVDRINEFCQSSP